MRLKSTLPLTVAAVLSVATVPALAAAPAQADGPLTVSAGPGQVLTPAPAEVTLTSSQVSGTTRHALIFSGQVTPAQVGERVDLQQQNATTQRWHTIAVGSVGADAGYAIRKGWRVAGPRTVRAIVRPDRLTTGGTSDPVTVVIEQRQAPWLTINPSAAVTTAGTASTISGTVDQPHSSAPESGATLQLLARTPGVWPFTVVQTTTSGSDGSYSFTVQSQTNELYRVQTTAAPIRRSAAAFVGAHETLTLSASTTTPAVGDNVAFSGTVTAGRAGQPVMLQRQGPNGYWWTVEVRRVAADSTFSLPWTFLAAGTRQLRARTWPDGDDLGGVSDPVTVTVTQ